MVIEKGKGRVLKQSAAAQFAAVRINCRRGRQPGPNMHAAGERTTPRGNRVKSAGMQRMALEEPAKRQPRSRQRAPLAHGLLRIDRAGWMKSAAARRTEYHGKRR
jgi:hypothetical protein